MNHQCITITQAQSITITTRPASYRLGYRIGKRLASICNLVMR